MSHIQDYDEKSLSRRVTCSRYRSLNLYLPKLHCSNVNCVQLRYFIYLLYSHWIFSFFFSFTKDNLRPHQSRTTSDTSLNCMTERNQFFFVASIQLKTTTQSIVTINLMNFRWTSRDKWMWRRRGTMFFGIGYEQWLDAWMGFAWQSISRAALARHHYQQ